MASCISSTSLERLIRWFPRWRSASLRSTNGCRQTDSSSIPKKHSSSGWAMLGSFRKLRSTPSLLLAAHCLSSSLAVNDLGVLIDGRLSMCHHVQRVCRSSYYQLRQLRVLRNSLSQQRRVQPWSTPLSQAGWTTAIACLPASTRNFWISWSQYCVRRHALPCENGSSTRYRRHAGYSHILHWLPVRQRIDFKLGILVFKCLRGDDPSYLVESVSSVADQPNRRSHRSATRGDLIVPRTRTVTMGPCSFYVSGSTLWNSLPLELRSYELTLETFMAKLKSHLFQSAYIH